MPKVKELFKNMVFLTISQFGTKLLSFFLVPLYTSVLTTTEYGTYDLFNTTVGLLIPFLTLNIKESSLRFALDAGSDQKEIFSISLTSCAKAALYASAMILINSIFHVSTAIDDFKWFVLILFIANAFNGVITNFARGLDRLGDIAVSGVVCSATIITLNIITLLPLHMGLVGYFWANIIGMMTQSIYLFIRFQGWKYISFRHVNLELKAAMYQYSIPMIANSTAWWINSVSDRYVVVWFCGIAANGIYSVANKIPSIMDVFQSIFSQAWTLSVVKDFDSDDRNGFMSKTFSLYNCSMTLICSLLIIFSRIIARFLYAKDFFSAWEYVPFLLIASTLGALSGYIGGIFTALKASRIFAYSTLTGAIVNLILNFLLVRRIGALGAAISTGISYCVIFAMRMFFVKKVVKLRVNQKRNVINYGILFVQSALLLYFSSECLILYLLETACFTIILVLFFPEIVDIIRFVVELFKKFRRRSE